MIEIKYNDPTYLDSIGIFPLVDESEDEFLKRAETILIKATKSETQNLCVDELTYELPYSERLDEKDQSKYSFKANEIYGISPNWIPAYYLDRGLPFLTGGMAVHYKNKDSHNWETFFQLKKHFKTKSKWFIYSAGEIVSHEMCHVARSSLNSNRYEETIAYQTSSSLFRRYIGGALVNPSDNLIFLIAVFWMLLCSIFLIQFDFFFFGMDFGPLVLITSLGLVRNHNIRKELNTCKKKLHLLFGESYHKILFRLSDSEIKQLSKCRNHDIHDWWLNIPNFRGDLLRKLFNINKKLATSKIQSNNN